MQPQVVADGRGSSSGEPRDRLHDVAVSGMADIPETAMVSGAQAVRAGSKVSLDGLIGRLVETV